VCGSAVGVVVKTSAVDLHPGNVPLTVAGDCSEICGQKEGLGSVTLEQRSVELYPAVGVGRWKKVEE